MFKIFTFGVGNIFNLNNAEKIGGIMQTFLNNIDISEFTQNYTEDFSEENSEKNMKESDVEFIKFEQDEEMYLLNIDLRGIDLRELSIRYDPGIIEINLNRSEIQKSGFGMFSNNMIVKRSYNKKFNSIEEIDTNQILKNIDNGILSIRMPKKYVLEDSTNIVEVESYEDNVDN